MQKDTENIQPKLVRIKVTGIKIVNYYFVAIITNNNYFSNNAWNQIYFDT